MLRLGRQGRVEVAAGAGRVGQGAGAEDNRLERRACGPVKAWDGIVKTTMMALYGANLAC